MKKASIALTLAASAALFAASAATFTNPLLPSGPDPWITRDGPVFYMMVTEGKRLAIRKALTLAALGGAEDKTVWTPPAHGPNAIAIWAPELHRIDGRWFLYYTAAEDGHDDDAHRGIFVLENSSTDPTQGEWIDHGKLATAHSGIDGTTFAYRGRRYFVYSPYVGAQSDLAIVRMSDPWTLSGPEVIIARPDREWETRGGRSILEGPEFLLGPRGDLFLTYSAGACWSDDYSLGRLHASPGSDPLDPAAWSKADRPVLTKAPQNDIYATGHNGFFTSPDGKEQWIVFHANAGKGLGCTAMRAPYAQRVSFDRAGFPVFAIPSGAKTPLQEPTSGTDAVRPSRTHHSGI